VNSIVPHDGGHPLAPQRDIEYATYTYPVEDTLKIDIRLIITIIKRNIYLIAAIFATMLLAGVAVTLLMTPRYTATASVQIDQEADRVLSTQDQEPNTAYQDADRFLQTQVDVLKSSALALRVANSMGLADNDKLFGIMKKPLPTPQPNIPADMLRKEAIVDLLSKNLGVNLPRNSRLALISFVSPDASFSAKVANAYANDYIEYNLERKYDSSSYARDFLSKQLNTAKDRLETSERALNAYARQAGLIKTDDAATTTGAPPTTGTQSITVASLVQLNSAANDAQADLVAATQKWRTTSAEPLLNIPEVVSNQAIQALLSQRADMQANLQKELAIHQDQYPSVLNLRAQVAELDRQIQVVAQGIKQSIYGNYQIAQQRVAQLTQQVNQLKGATLSEQDRTVQYNILAREADTNRTMYDGLLQRFKEVSAEAGITNNNVMVVDEAQPPVLPSSPKLLLNLALAFVLGAILSAAAVFVREQMDDVVRGPEDVERKLGLSPLGIIPAVGTGERVTDLLESPRSHVSEAYHSLRTSLLYATVDGLPKSLLITSSQAAEGKSTTSYAIALDLAKIGKRVLLVDVDLRRPSLHGVIGVTNEKGLSSVLTHQVRIESVIVEASQSNLSFVASGPIPINPTELLTSPLMRDLLRRLIEQYDIVIMDGPPVLGLADSPLLAGMAEGTLFIVESNRGSRGATKGALKRLQAAKANILGLVLTKFDAKKAGTSAYYAYEYYQYGGDQDEPSDRISGPASPETI
jgi:polysaccharide biosynthesis transport protein